jgi:protein SCO1
METQNTTKKTFSPVLVILFFVVIIMLMLVYHTMRKYDESGKLEAITKVPHFSLVNQLGEIITNDDLIGTYWIANFIFTNCGGTCPVMTFHMRELQNSIPPELPVRFVSISVDPERDTPDVLRAYAEEWRADTTRWYFLTGDQEEIYSLTRRGFLLGLSPDGGSLIEPIMHSQRFVLVDQEGLIRGYYEGFDDADIDQLKEDLFYLLHKTV